MNYKDIFRPETLQKLDKGSAENLRQMLGDKNLMQTLQSSMGLLNQVIEMEEPYKAQLEELAVQMVEDMYPIIHEDNINIDAKIVGMGEINRSLDEIKINPPTKYNPKATDNYKPFEKGKNSRVTIYNLLKNNPNLSEKQITTILSEKESMYNSLVVGRNLSRGLGNGVKRHQYTNPITNRKIYLYSIDNTKHVNEIKINTPQNKIKPFSQDNRGWFKFRDSKDGKDYHNYRYSAYWTNNKTDSEYLQVYFPDGIDGEEGQASINYLKRNKIPYEITGTNEISFLSDYVDFTGFETTHPSLLDEIKVSKPNKFRIQHFADSYPYKEPEIVQGNLDKIKNKVFKELNSINDNQYKYWATISKPDTEDPRWDWKEVGRIKKVEGEYKYSPTNFNENTINENTPESKRRVINGITQGAALRGAFSFYLFKEYLDVIDPNLIEKYNQLMKEVFGVYDDPNAIAMFLQMLAMGQKMGGGSSKVIINEIKINKPGINFPIKLDTYNDWLKIKYKLVKLGYVWFNDDKLYSPDFDLTDEEFPLLLKSDDNKHVYTDYIEDLNESLFNKLYKGAQVRFSDNKVLWFKNNINGKEGFFTGDQGIGSYRRSYKNIESIDGRKLNEIKINKPNSIQNLIKNNGDYDYIDTDVIRDILIKKFPYESKQIEEYIYDIDPDDLESYENSNIIDIINDYKLYKKYSLEDLNEQEQKGITIKARALCFPMLVHEIIKGLYELVSLQGFQGTKDQNQAVVDKVDKLEHEPEDIKYGKLIFDALNDIFANSGYNDNRIREYFFAEVYQLGDAEFIEFIEGAINDELTQSEKRWVQQTLKEISLDLRDDDYDSTGLDEIKINSPDVPYQIMSRGKHWYKEYIIEKIDGSEMINMFFDSFDEALKFADKKGYKIINRK